MTLFEKYTVLTEVEKNNGKDMAYALPEKEKFPLYDKKHVLLAIKFFNYVESEDEEKLANAIKRKIKEFGIESEINPGKENRFSNYWKKQLTENEGSEEMENLGWKMSSAYEKIISELKNNSGEENEKVEELQKEIESLKKQSKNFDCECEKKEAITESVLDPVREERCKDLFTKDNKVIPEIRKYILDSIEEWKTIYDFEVKIDTITLTGSLLSFQYSASTDLDCHIKLNNSEEELKIMRKSVPTACFIPNTLHPIEFSLNITGDPIENVMDVYDLKEDKWVKQSEKIEVDIPRHYITSITRFFMNALEISFSNIEITKRELKEIEDDDISKNIPDEDKLKFILKKREDLQEQLDSLRVAIAMMRSIRRRAYSEERYNISISIELDLPNDPHYSINELVFKTIDRFGYYGRLKNYLKELEEIIKKIDEMKLPIKNGEETINRESTKKEDNVVESPIK